MSVVPPCRYAGQPPAVPSLVHIGAKLNQEQVRAMVTHGKGLMPAFNKLSAEDLDRLNAFLFSSAPATAAQSAAAK